MKKDYTKIYRNLTPSEWNNFADSYAIFRTVRGSRVMGLNIENVTDPNILASFENTSSDVDEEGLFFNPTFELNRRLYTETVSTQSHDMTLQSLDKFQTELESGNFNSIEMICIDREWWITPPPESLMWVWNNIERFITKNSLIQSARFAYNQTIGKYKEEREQFKKNKLISHAVRAVNTCLQCIKESESLGSPVPFKIDRTGIDSDEILAIKYQTPDNQMSDSDMINLVNQKRLDLVKAIEEDTVIPTTISDDTKIHLLTSILHTKGVLLGMENPVSAITADSIERTREIPTPIQILKG